MNKSWKKRSIIIATIFVFGSGLLLYNNASKEAEAANKEPSVVEVNLSPAFIKDAKDNVTTIYASDYYYNLTSQPTNDLPADQIAYGAENANSNTVLIIENDGKTYIRAGIAQYE
ncbi:hypothetical protein QE450_001365 [Paenibacillus sp. SORGH_AS306]|uniref:hypothetical protein n=1 Tax=unclassified Paenibacillus TaxID=185978 RepID=UPI0027807ACC|nr:MULTISPECIES: hypothetical protein [unclassified Paenibacillus]MDQ1233867.1 hypothetical protein [Paenibacillus sp. SORGH_AS_0306]MDR6110912.1 hypothetical protein [Paenibacillus sp. SORGH_AS_0338]